MVLENNISYLKEEFFKSWLNGKLDRDELNIRMKNFNINYSNNMGLILIKILEKNFVGIVNKNERELISYGIINFSNEFMNKFKDVYVFRYVTLCQEVNSLFLVV